MCPKTSFWGSIGGDYSPIPLFQQTLKSGFDSVFFFKIDMRKDRNVEGMEIECIMVVLCRRENVKKEGKEEGSLTVSRLITEVQRCTTLVVTIFTIFTILSQLWFLQYSLLSFHRISMASQAGAAPNFCSHQRWFWHNTDHLELHICC